MLISKGQEIMPLKLTDNGRVLELMYDEKMDANMYFEGIQEMETIEEEPDMACLLTCAKTCEYSYKHSVLCGSPFSYLFCKVKRKESFEAVIVHADRIRCSPEMWRMIVMLMPTWIIIMCRSRKKGELHKKMMWSCGFELLDEGESSDGKIYVGRKRISK